MISYTPHYFERIDTESSVFSRLEHLIRKHAPRLMKTGGGYLRREAPGAGVAITDEKRAAIIADRLATNDAQWAIAQRHGVSQACVGQVLIKAGLRVGRGGHNSYKRPRVKKEAA